MMARFGWYHSICLLSKSNFLPLLLCKIKIDNMNLNTLYEATFLARLWIRRKLYYYYYYYWSINQQSTFVANCSFQLNAFIFYIEDLHTLPFPSSCSSGTTNHRPLPNRLYYFFVLLHEPQRIYLSFKTSGLTHSLTLSLSHSRHHPQLVFHSCI